MKISIYGRNSLRRRIATCESREDTCTKRKEDRASSAQPHPCREKANVRQHRLTLSPKSNKFMGRKPSQKRMAFPKQKEDTHGQVAKESQRMWRRLRTRTADSPDYHEHGAPDEAINAEKRGRQCSLESCARGSNRTRRSIRDLERSAKRYGNINIDEERLIGYPRARTRYVHFMSELRRMAGRDSRTVRKMSADDRWKLLAKIIYMECYV